MRVVLTGDSHLAEVSPRRQVTKLAPRLRQADLDVVCVAVGGTDSRGLAKQAMPPAAEQVICSIGTNDAAPWKQVPIDEFAERCARWLGTVASPSPLVLGPGPVVEHGVPGERTNVVMARYASALEQVGRAGGARFVSMMDVLDVADLADEGVHIADSGYAKLTERVLAELRGTRSP